MTTQLPIVFLCPVECTFTTHEGPFILWFWLSQGFDGSSLDTHSRGLATCFCAGSSSLNQVPWHCPAFITGFHNCGNLREISNYVSKVMWSICDKSQLPLCSCTNRLYPGMSLSPLPNIHPFFFFFQCSLEGWRNHPRNSMVSSAMASYARRLGVVSTAAVHGSSSWVFILIATDP